MSGCKVSIALFFLFPLLLLGQRTELKHWDFHSENDPSIQKVSIPHTWNVRDAFDDERGYWRGKGFYEKTLAISDIEKAYFLHFEGANQKTKVWVNDTYAGEHHGGYTAFHVNLTPFLKVGENSIKVEVDNAHDETVPPLDADFTFYGGIYRPVFLEKEHPVHFKKEHGADAITIDALLEDALQQGIVKVRGGITNSDRNSVSLKITLLDADDMVLHNEKVSATYSFEQEFVISSPLLWSPESPHLYRLVLELRDGDQLVDSYERQIGFRKFEATPSGFFLNDSPLKLIGVNRHQDWEGYGNAVPIALQLKDMAAIKEMGSNFLRLAHYPQSKEIYKAADSLGLILWSEIPVVNKVPTGEAYEAYAQNSLDMQREHIAQNYNHPSLVFVGYMNEIFLRMVFDRPKEEEKQQIVQNTLDLAHKLEEMTRREAPHHITVMAVHGNQIYNDTKIAEIPMVIGWNLYYGWYEGVISDLGGFLDAEHEKYPNRPLIISEYGVGADIRLHTDAPMIFDFSEEYQLQYHKGYVEQVMERDYVIGMSAWNFADFGSEFRGDAMPHINQKGLVNYDRSPKNIFYWYKAKLRPEEQLIRMYRDLPVHISTSNEKKIKIIANTKTVLKVNDSVYSVSIPKDGIIETSVRLKEGKNALEAYNENGKKVDSLGLLWKKPQTTQKGDVLAINLGTHTRFLDSNGQIWIPASDIPALSFTGKTNDKKTSANIRMTPDDPFYQTAVSEIQKMTLAVPEGLYKVVLYTSNFGKSKKLAYELDKEKGNTVSDTDGAMLLVSGKETELLKPERFHFDTLEIEVGVKNKGIEISAKNKTPFSLSAIYVKKIE
ncbi:glycoside hydrolase family 2 TIM barrel-domain containing protein [Allomuricauda sp. d1]|uniref:glycoside hydrolase family 2 protein n=1 Tax=Allomuricauda sp. d1 TaxID=3136725 RepID=UPI0031DB11A0